MKNAAAFRASYADWKLIKTRGCVQVVMEIPLHEADAAYQALGGMPDPAAERWFGIARLSNVAGEPASLATREADGDLGGPSTTVSRHRKPVDPSRRLAQQAGIACADPLFQKFVGARNEDTATTFVRQTCGVQSRSEIKIATPEGEIWQQLYGEFLVWRDAPEMSDCQGERV
jgi:hypothetical protein